MGSETYIQPILDYASVILEHKTQVNDTKLGQDKERLSDLYIEGMLGEYHQVFLMHHTWNYDRRKTIVFNLSYQLRLKPDPFHALVNSSKVL